MAHPVVLITGGDDFLAEREVQRVVRSLRKLNPELAREDVDAAAESAAMQFAEVCSPSLFGDTPVVVVDNVEQSDDSMQTSLLELAANPNGEVHVLLLVRGGVKGRGLVDKLKKSGIEHIELVLPKGRGIDDFIHAEFKQHARKPPTADATQALRAAVGDDLRALSAAVSQLAFDVEADPITETEVERYYEGMAGVAPYEVTDAAFNGQVTAALVKLRWALDRDPGIGPAIVASGLAGVRGLVAVTSAPSSLPDADLARTAGVPPWKVRILREQGRRWGSSQLADALLMLTRADAALKGGEIDELGQVQVLDPAQRQALLERTIVGIASLVRSRG